MNLVLDLDQTLICSKSNSEISLKRLKMFEKNPELKYKVYYFGKGEDLIWGVYRPGLTEFIQWATDFFDNVIVWSAGTNIYVKEITRAIWNEAGLVYPTIIFSREKCTGVNEHTHKIMENLFNDESAKKLNITKYNTVILDDNLNTISKNKDNSIYIVPYSPHFTRNGIANTEDNSLDKVRKWFESLKKDIKNNSKFDIRKYDKSIFEIIDEN